MAARKNRGVTSLPEEWKEKIKATQIVHRLQKHVDGEIEMTNTQVQAAKILLGKVAPDLSKAELTGKDGADLPPTSIIIQGVNGTQDPGS